MFLHVALDIGPKHLLLAIWTCGILVFSQVLKPDVPLAVGLVGEGAFAGETEKGSIKLALAELVGCFQHCRCNRLRLKEDQDLEISQPNALVLATSTTRIHFTGMLWVHRRFSYHIFIPDSEGFDMKLVGY